LGKRFASGSSGVRRSMGMGQDILLRAHFPEAA